MATTKTTNAKVTVEIITNDRSTPPGRLADAELHFSDCLLAGTKLIGFTVWERRTGGGRNVTFPARTYAVNGERRSFALLCPVTDTAARRGAPSAGVLLRFSRFNPVVASLAAIGQTALSGPINFVPPAVGLRFRPLALQRANLDHHLPA